MQMNNERESSLKDNRYVYAEVEVVHGEMFEKAYNDYLDRRVAMAMRHVAEFVDSGVDVKELAKRLHQNNDI